MSRPSAGQSSQQPSQAERPAPGLFLRRERQRQNLSVRQIADDLNLDLRVVEAIEAERFSALGPPVYARGYLRKYAVRLGVAPQTILDAYEALHAAGSLGSSATKSADAALGIPAVSYSKRPVNTPVWIALLILVLGFAVLWIWKFAETPPTEQSSRVRTTPSPQAQSTPAQARAAADENASASDVQSTPPEPLATPVAPPEESAAPMPERSANESTKAVEVELVLAFSEPSWTEVYDAAGQKLMFDTGQAGQTRKLSGSAPLTVVLGRAASVNATVGGRAIAIPVRENRDSAKFAVEADGTVR